jgi:hypothetical protein
MVAGSGTGSTTLKEKVWELTSCPWRSPPGIKKSGALLRRSKVSVAGTPMELAPGEITEKMRVKGGFTLPNKGI